IELEARLIDDLLDVTRISRGKLTVPPAPCDLHELLRHSEEIVRSDGLGSGVATHFDLQASHHHTRADAARLHQVFWNLLKNALKFTPAGGSVSISTRNNAQGQFVFTVEDTGVGIRREMLPRIFHAFEQGDISGQHRFGGLGLGLAISKAIVEAHGGKISADSPGLGLGASFEVTLDTIDAAKTAPPDAKPSANGSPSLRILIVEDHEATKTMMARLLKLGGHQVTLASTVGEAHASYLASVFDVVISDLGLPDGNGLDLMRQMQQVRPVQAIALSGYGMEDDVRRSREAGFFAHLIKPVSIVELRRLLDQMASSAGGL
ncbi:MAG TPA: ATP-binding protein, partial [Prosthecobacter sp.]